MAMVGCTTRRKALVLACGAMVLAGLLLELAQLHGRPCTGAGCRARHTYRTALDLAWQLPLPRPASNTAATANGGVAAELLVLIMSTATRDRRGRAARGCDPGIVAAVRCKLRWRRCTYAWAQPHDHRRPPGRAHAWYCHGCIARHGRAAAPSGEFMYLINLDYTFLVRQPRTGAAHRELLYEILFLLIVFFLSFSGAGRTSQ